MRHVGALFSTSVLVLMLAGSALAVNFYIPHITGGEDDWKDTLVIDNFGAASANATVNLYDQGRLLTSNTYTVRAYDYVAINVKLLAPAAASGVISTEATTLASRISYEYLATGERTEFDLQTAGLTSNVYLFPKYYENLSWAGLAITNTTATVASVTLYAIGSGLVLDQTTDTVPGRGRIKGLHSDWFPNTALSLIDKILVISPSANLQGITISGNSDNSMLLFTPAVDAGF